MVSKRDLKKQQKTLANPVVEVNHYLINCKQLNELNRSFNVFATCMQKINSIYNFFLSGLTLEHYT